MGTVALCLGMTLTELCVFLIAFIQYIFDKKKHFKHKCISEDHFTSVVTMALPLALSAYIRSALLTLEHTIIPKRLEKSGESHSNAISLYGILHGMALPVLLYPMVTISSFAGLLVPEFSESLAKGENEKMKKITEDALSLTLSYAVATSVLLYVFSEEIGLLLYNSNTAGYYVALMCPVIPIMYLDHVTDFILKGIGEHVYSMWVNITDSILSIGLVFVLIGKMGISGYALVIVIMEGYNFILSRARLKSKIKYKINYLKSVLLPLISMGISAHVSTSLFKISGATTTPVWLFLRILFAFCVFLTIYLLISSFLQIIKKRKRNANKSCQST
jgi:stage V sporulation protein B